MDILYVNTKKIGYDKVKVEDNKTLYDGRSGTIPVKSDAEYLHATIYSSVVEKNKNASILSLINLFFAGLVGLGLGNVIIKPYYFKITLHKQLFMQLQFDPVYAHAFTSNVLMKQEKIKDAMYRKLWLISYILPLQFVVICMGILLYLLSHSTLMIVIFGLLMVISQLNIIYKCFNELK